MRFKARLGKHLIAVGASMAGGAIAGSGIVLGLSSFSPHVSHISSPVAEVASPSPSDSPTPDASPSVPSPSSAPTAAPTAATAPAPAPATAAPTAAPAPTCATGQAILSMSGTGRWDGTFAVPAECGTYTYRWNFGPAPAICRTWTLAFYPDVNGQGPEYTQAGPASGGGSESVHNPGGRVQSEVNLYDPVTGGPASCSIPWSIAVTAG